MRLRDLIIPKPVAHSHHLSYYIRDHETPNSALVLASQICTTSCLNLKKYFVLSNVAGVFLLLAAKPSIYVSKFPSSRDGWNCGRTTTCGDFGEICGGFGVKGAGSDIQKTFNLPAGVYSVQLDFIKIDSWFVRVFVRM